jgi:hypothetical protein
MQRGEHLGAAPGAAEGGDAGRGGVSVWPQASGLPGRQHSVERL